MKIRIIKIGDKNLLLNLDIDPIVMAKDIPYFLIVVVKKTAIEVTYMYNSYERAKRRTIKSDIFQVIFDSETKNIYKIEFSRAYVETFDSLEIKKLFHEHEIVLNENIRFNLDILQKALVELKLTKSSS